MIEPSIEELLQAHEQADPQTRRRIAETLLERVDGQIDIWGTHNVALANVLFDLNQVRAFEAVISGTQEFSEKYCDQMTNLHNAYFDLIRAEALSGLGYISGKTAALHEAIPLFERTLVHWSKKKAPQQWSEVQKHLAWAYLHLGELTVDPQLISKCINLCDETLDTAMQYDRPRDCAMLVRVRADAVIKRWEIDGNPDLLPKTASSVFEAIQTLDKRQAPFDWAACNQVLGQLFFTLGRIADDPESFATALEFYNAASEIITHSHHPEYNVDLQMSKASAKRQISRLTGDPSFARSAVDEYKSLLETTLDPKRRAKLLHNAAFALLQLRQLDNHPHSDYNQYLLVESMNFLKESFEINASSGLAFEALQSGKFLVTEVALSVGLRKVREYSWVVEKCLSISDAAIRDAARSAEGKIAALHIVSEFHALKAQILVSRRGHSEPPETGFDKSKPNCWYFRAIKADWEVDWEAAAWEAALAVEAGRARLARDAISAEVPEGVTTPEALAAAAPEGGALVYPALTAVGALVFVVRREGPPIVLDLPELTEEALVARYNGEDGWLAAQARAKDAMVEGAFRRGSGPWSDWNAHLDAQAAWLHAHLLGPIDETLGTTGMRPAGGDHPGDPVVLMPTGLLGQLPLAAARARPGDPAFCARWSVTLAPSAAMRAACRSRAARLETVLASFHGLYTPTGSYRGTEVDGPLLHGAGLEADFARDHLSDLPQSRRRLLRDEDATLAAAEAAAKEATHLHFSAHGSGDPIVPGRGGITLCDGRLSIDRLQQTRLSARLVTLSACESGIAGIRRAPEEFVGLPTAMLAAGAAAAISTLWSVNDDTATTFTTRFLAAHLNPDGSEKTPPAKAFRDTQRWMRNVTAKELATNAAWCWPGSSATAQNAMQSNEAAAAHRKLGAYTVARPPTPPRADTRPFADPHDWAAFTYSGA